MSSLSVAELLAALHLTRVLQRRKKGTPIYILVMQRTRQLPEQQPPQPRALAQPHSLGQ